MFPPSLDSLLPSGCSEFNLMTAALVALSTTTFPAGTGREASPLVKPGSTPFFLGRTSSLPRPLILMELSVASHCFITSSVASTPLIAFLRLSPVRLDASRITSAFLIRACCQREGALEASLGSHRAPRNWQPVHLNNLVARGQPFRTSWLAACALVTRRGVAA